MSDVCARQGAERPASATGWYRPASGMPASGKPAQPFTAIDAAVGLERQRELRRVRRDHARVRYLREMGDAVTMIAVLQRVELERASELPPGHPDRLRVLVALGEKILDRLIGKSTTKVEHDGEVGIAHKIAQLAAAE